MLSVVREVFDRGGPDGTGLYSTNEMVDEITCSGTPDEVHE